MSIDSTNIKDHSEGWDLFITNGSKNAFCEIYYGYFDIMFRFGMKYTNDSQIIEDSIQNLFIYLLNNRKKLTPVKNLKSYLLKSFRNQLIKDLKKQKSLVTLEQIIESQVEYFSSTEQTIIENEELNKRKAILRKCMGELKPKQQELIHLRFDCEMSYQEIADILEINVDACYKSIYRLIKLIKSEVVKAKGINKDFFFWFIFQLESSMR
ncbi:sigma-70 family RNA polymerase sigma factor [uncultured Sunxiuqinia sp.]|uniref:RNA polymerase sigma factor n=1 Tax=uncultured Sunxiuqinia sp. TaxID=1573825 RepID=UPI002AA75705|nr:sigma-70 family RNA polymerase sigma factor [uncultured Sunxiuqinia sp.]